MGNTAYAILHEIDKCMKCRGCQVACQRAQGLGTTYGDDAKTVQFDDPTVVKAQKDNDSPPFVRYSCWHCDAPTCATACPLGAIKQTTEGAVWVDRAMCNPASSECVSAGKPCATKCHRGGYPKIGTADPGLYAYKCDMCKDRIGGPACVETCPAKALTYDTKANITAKLTDPLNAAKYKVKVGGNFNGNNGNMFWASSKPFNPPTTDPFIEDHISPMLGRLINAPVSRVLVLPTLLFGGIYALYRRRLELTSEPKEAI